MSEAHQREAALFDEALELPPAERAAHLERACGDDAGLRQRVEALLKACESQCEFLDSPTDPAVRQTFHITVPVTEKAGDRIGRYKLLEQIGEGGCGVVYVAEQEEPVRRRVAFKIIKLGMDTKSVIARFEAERQALALMDHPNIAKVFDAGATEAGRPYFVMELVRGMKITDYCDEAKLSTSARLDLFIQVCQAIQHAHQKGIIHRDIKPSNILVTVNDGVAVPKVIDFGIAKATSGQRLTDKTIYTAFEQFIGTPAYMSPEQAVLTSLDIDTRSDIYALGVLLYELLTGKTPFDVKELLAIGLDEMRRTIREQEPPRPSTRLNTLPGQELSTTAQRRGIAAPKLVSELRGDLDWIVMKAMEKDRSRRYETANGLAADIQRHLNDEPVVACPPSRLYRLQKTVRRNKPAFVAGSAVAASLLIGLTLSTVLFFRERTARKRANEQASRADEQAAIARAVNEFLQQDLLVQASSFQQAAAHFTPDPNLTMREAVNRAAERIGDRFKDQPLQEAAVRMAIGEAMTGGGEASRALAHLQSALEIYRAKLGLDHPVTLMAMGKLTVAYAYAAKPDQALPLGEETLKLHKARLGPDHPDTLGAMNNLVIAYDAARKLDQALALGEETLTLVKAKRPDHPITLSLMHNLAAAYFHAGKLDQAVPLEEETLRIEKSKLGPDHPQTLLSMHLLAVAYWNAGKRDMALTLLEETAKLNKAKLGLDHPVTLEAMTWLAQVYLETGKLEQAMPLFEETLKLHKAKFGPTHVHTLATMRSLARAYRETGQVDRALPLFEELLKLNAATRGPNDPETVFTVEGLAKTYRRAGKLDQLEAMFRELLAQESGPVITPAVLRVRAEYRAQRGTFSEAAVDLRQAIEINPDPHETWHALAPLLAVTGQLDAYREYCRKSAERFGKSSDPNTAERIAKDCLILPDSGADLTVVAKMADTAAAATNHPDTPWFQLVKGLAEYRQGRFASAVEWMNKTLSKPDESNRDVEAYLVLAMAHYQLKQTDAAQAAFAKGVEIERTKLPKLESGDIGEGWLDWIIGHALMREAKALMEGDTKTSAATE